MLFIVGLVRKCEKFSTKFLTVTFNPLSTLVRSWIQSYLALLGGRDLLERSDVFFLFGGGNDGSSKPGKNKVKPG